jgi:transposase
MFYGLDVHKEFIQVCALGAKGTKRKEYRIGASAEAVEEFARTLHREDQVVLEATFHTWALHDILTRYVPQVVVANPLQVKAIAQAKIKTDKVDAFTLARLLRADFLPAVQMPERKTWALRQLVSHRRLLVKQRTATKNAIHAVLSRRLVHIPHADPFSQRARKWMKSLELPPAEDFLLRNSLALLEDLDDRVDAADQQLLAHASLELSARLLMTIPGVGTTVAIGLVAAIGDVRRFDTPQQLASYLGLVPRVSQSAGRCHHGRITKAGSSSARALAIEAAQVLARSSSPLTATYWRVLRKRGHNVAVTALARKLIIVVWHLLKNREPYRYTEPHVARRKLRKATPPQQKQRAKRVPATLEAVYEEAGLPPLAPPPPAERRAAAINRRARTRIARSFKAH